MRIAVFDLMLCYKRVNNKPYINAQILRKYRKRILVCVPRCPLNTDFTVVFSDKIKNEMIIASLKEMMPAYIKLFNSVFYLTLSRRPY